MSETTPAHESEADGRRATLIRLATALGDVRTIECIILQEDIDWLYETVDAVRRRETMEDFARELREAQQRRRQREP